MEKEEEALRRRRDANEAEHDNRMEKERQKDVQAGAESVNERYRRLEFLLQKSQLYANIMLAEMTKEEEAAKDGDREEKAERIAEDAQRHTTRATTTAQSGHGEQPVRKGRGVPKMGSGQKKISSFFKKEDVQAHAKKDDDGHVKMSDMGIQKMKSARQPKLVTGGNMRVYQLEGLEWLFQLYTQGVNGILADEMGLGKTIQTIAFLALLREKKSYGPFLIAAPLSTTTNWVEEFRKWTPSIPVILYHGTKDERAEIRAKRFKNPGSPDFPIVVTSYEICMNDRKFLDKFGWTFLVIDEGHRIKNMDCRLIRELQNYRSANRLLITGTPLQNNLTELWSLLHFLMPDIFTDLQEFESWFDFSSLRDRKSYDAIFTKERKENTIAKLHAILRPFLLRRVKTDVEKMLPKKREYILYAPLTKMQQELYQAIVTGTSRAYLEEKAMERLSMSGSATPNSVRSRSLGVKRKLGSSRANTPNKSAKTSRDSTPTSSVRSGLRGRKRKNYEEISNAQYFSKLNASSEDESDHSDFDDEEVIRERSLALAKRQIASKKLQNPIMQLRLCCNSPYNFFDPFAIDSCLSGDVSCGPDETLVTTSGKMILLDSLLPKLFDGDHKVPCLTVIGTHNRICRLWIVRIALDKRGT